MRTQPVPRAHADTILDRIRGHAERHADKLLYAFLDLNGQTTESFTYEGFLQRTTDIAAHILRVHPLCPGERAILVYPPGVEMICAFFACVRLGLIPVPVYPPSSHGFAAALYKMSFIARDCRAAIVLTDRSYFWSMRVHEARANPEVSSPEPGYLSGLPCVVTSDAEPNGQDGVREVRSEILFLQYTSGSTSDPKGVIVTHRNVIDNGDVVFDHVPTGVSWLPQYHDMGLIGAYLFVALAGGTTYGFSPSDFIRRPLLWLEAMSRYRATASAAPSFAYDYCQRPDRVPDESLTSIDLGSLRLLMNAAEPVRADVFRGFLRRFAPRGLDPKSFSAAYGLAECTLAVSNRGRTIVAFDARRLSENEAFVVDDPSFEPEVTELVACGRPVGTTEVKVVDVTGPPREAPPGRIGEIWVTGPGKCVGYWNRPDLSAEVFEARLEGADESGSKWLRTGDLGFVRDGELFICGRAKDLIIIRGLNYYPQDVEALVEEDPAIRKGCAAAFSVERHGQEALVVVAGLKNVHRLPDTESIHRRIRERLGIVADSFVYVPARTIPRTSSGKIQRHQARLQWLEDRLGVVARIETARLADPTMGGVSGGGATPDGSCVTDAETPLHKIFRRYRLTGTESATLGEIGLDSLAIAELAADLERHLKVRGADKLADAIDLRWLQRIAVSELFELLDQVDAGAPRAMLGFKRAFAALRSEQQRSEHGMMRRDAQFLLDAPTPPATDGASGGGGGILLTGGTGFFGPFLLRSLLEQCDGEIYVVVRASDPAEGKERLRNGLASLGASGDRSSSSPSGSAELGVPEDWEERVIPICGDLSQPQLGVSGAQWSFLDRNVRAIYHNGALVNYLLDYAAMRSVNVGGTREVVRLATSHRAKIVNYVSTTFVFGWSSRDTLFESDDNQDMKLLDFGYSQSKWASEQVVLGAMRQGLAARVFRPALITPSVSGGGDNFDIAMRLLVFMLKYGVTTTARNQVSFSPADLVADNIVAISNLPDTLGQTFHVTRDAYSSMLDITSILGELTHTRFLSYSLQEFVPFVIEHCRKDDLLFPLLNFLVRSVDNITAMEFKRYDNRNYREARARSPFGREDPPLEDVVLGIVRFLRRHGVADGRDSEPVLREA